MKIVAFFFVLFLVLSNTIFAQQYWGKTTTSSYTNEAIDVETDAAGNMYVAGYFSGGTSFEQNIAQITSQGANDIYVSKYDPNGNFVWVKTFGGTFSDSPTDLVVDNAGNIIITGQFFGQISFGTNSLTSSASSKDIFLVKLNGLGNVIWAKKEGGPDSENAYGLAVDSQNNVILTGQFKGASFIGGQNVSSLIDPTTNTANFDLFVSKYSSTGIVQWIKTGQAKYEERGLSVACDSQNNIFITGQFSDTLTISGTTINNNAFNVGFVSKLSSSGTFLWLNQMKAGFVLPYDIEVNSLDEPVIIGDYSGSMVYIHSGGNTSITAPHSKRIFAIKIANSGNAIWQNSFSSDNELSARSLSIDASKNIYITGFFRCSWTQFHNSSTATFNSVGFKDAYLLQITNLGALASVKTFGSKLNDEGQGVAISSSQEPIICGTHTNQLHIPTNGSLTNYNFNGSVFGFSYSSFPQAHVSLIGDLSANSFLTNAVHGGIGNYNFFNSTPTDSLIGFVFSNTSDTVNFCSQTNIAYNTLTDPTYGPDYTYLWNTGATVNPITIYQSGTFSVFVERADQCSFGDDTVIGILHATPPFPLLTNSLGLTNSTFYPDYTLCQPDSVIISFSNLCTGCSIQVTPAGIIDTLAHSYHLANLYHVNINNGYCTSTQDFWIHVDSLVPYNAITPYLSFADDTDFNDTIVACVDDYLILHVFDSLTNPTGIVGQNINEPIAFQNFSTTTPIAYGNYLTNNQGYHFIPTTTAWYVFTYLASIGYNNSCGLDTTNYLITDSVYIIVNQLPGGNSTITATDSLCPNGSVYLLVSPVYSGLSWSGMSGANIAYTSPNNDSIQVGSAGYYNYSGFLTDTITGCTNFVNNFFLLAEKQPPVVSTNPVDGIICPGDSVTFMIPNQYLSYNWVGPNGTNLSSVNTHIDDHVGFYYCHIIDSSGCALTTAPSELKQYTTPSIFATPQSVICGTDPIVLNASFTGQAQVNWINPSWAGNSPQIVVTLPGVYICEIDQCGILTMDTVVITDGSFSVTLNATDSLLCFGETALLTVNSGYNSYVWSPSANSSNTNSVNASGAYSVIVTNQFGCEAKSDTIQIDAVPLSFPPLIADTAVCLGNGITLSTPNSIPVEWYSSANVYLSTGTTFTFPSLYQDTVVFATYNVFGCPNAYQDIDVEVLLPIVGGLIMGDTIICSNANSQLSLNLTQGNIEWFVNSASVGMSPTYTISGQASQAAQQVMAIITNQCFSDTLYQTIYTIASAPLTLSTDTILICGNSVEVLSATTLFDTLFWFTPFGQITANTLTVDNSYASGTYVVAQGISANGCWSTIDSTFIEVPTGPQIDIYSPTNICLNDSILLSSNITSNSMIWSGSFGAIASNTASFVLNNPTENFTLTFDSLGCSWNKTTTIQSLPIPYILTVDTVICFTDWYQLANPNNDVVFTNMNGSMIDTLTMFDNSWFQFTVTSSTTGCSVLDSIYIETVSCNNIVPNVITPNGDGINDNLIIDKALIQPNNQLVIVNRWGNIVYTMNGYTNQWQGEDLTDGVYFYTYFPDRYNSNLSVVKGFIHITR